MSTDTAGDAVDNLDALGREVLTLVCAASRHWCPDMPLTYGIQSWADGWIARLQEPPHALIELALLSRGEEDEARRLLRALPRTEPYNRAEILELTCAWSTRWVRAGSRSVRQVIPSITELLFDMKPLLPHQEWIREELHMLEEAAINLHCSDAALRVRNESAEEHRHRFYALIADCRSSGLCLQTPLTRHFSPPAEL